MTVTPLTTIKQRKWLAAGLLSLSLGTVANAAEGPPGTDIYMADLSKEKSGFWKTKTFKNITPRKGYDNQPFFLPDGSGLLYTAISQMSNSMWQADTFEYNFGSKKRINLTNSNLSEYSPILMKGAKTFSSVVVEKDNKQYLWSLPFHSKSKAGRLFNIEPVGYHAWSKRGDIAMFVLGSNATKNKATLEYLPNLNAKPKVVATDIGRSLRYTPERNSFSFTHKKTGGVWWLSEYNPDSDTVTVLVPLPKESDYYTWIDAKTAVTSVGNVLHLWNYSREKGASVEDWVPWVDASATCKTKISRLAVNNDQSKFALVCDE